MSYAIELDEKPRIKLASLPVHLQEALWDKIDELAKSGGLLPRRPLPHTMVADCCIFDEYEKHYFFLTVRFDDQRQVLVIVSVGHHKTP